MNDSLLNNDNFINVLREKLFFSIIVATLLAPVLIILNLRSHSTEFDLSISSHRSEKIKVSISIVAYFTLYMMYLISLLYLMFNPNILPNINYIFIWLVAGFLLIVLGLILICRQNIVDTFNHFLKKNK